MFVRALVRLTPISLLACLFGCGGGPPLDYQTAMDLLRDHSMDPVKVTFSATRPNSAHDVRIERAFDDLVGAHILACPPAVSSVGAVCSPGPAAEGVETTGPAELSVVAGAWIPAAVTAINRTGRSTATAEARLQFEPSDIYRGMHEAFDALQTPDSAAANGDRKQGKMIRANFQRDDDGWHLEDVH